MVLHLISLGVRDAPALVDRSRHPGIVTTGSSPLVTFAPVSTTSCSTRPVCSIEVGAPIRPEPATTRDVGIACATPQSPTSAARTLTVIDAESEQVVFHLFGTTGARVATPDGGLRAVI